jgi:hypothetical protein
MIARCKFTAWSLEDVAQSEGNPHFTPQFALTKDRDYLVLGVQFIRNSSIYGRIALFEIEQDDGLLLSIPNTLFDVIDGRVSKWWTVRQDANGDLKIWPQEFYRNYFHDDLSNGDAEAVTAFRQIRKKLGREFGWEDNRPSDEHLV